MKPSVFFRRTFKQSSDSNRVRGSSFVSASVPAFLAAALAYVLLTKPLVQPLGKGGYETATEKRVAIDAEAEERRERPR